MAEVTWELKVLNDEHGKVQKTINQWKHKYKVKIQSMHPDPHVKGHSIAYLIRIDK